jgi:hypothetical protein
LTWASRTVSGSGSYQLFFAPAILQNSTNYNL